MILNDTHLHHIGPDVLDPFDPAMVQPASIDLKLGTTFRVNRLHEVPVIDLARMPSPDQLTEEVVKPLYREICVACGGRGLWIPAPGLERDCMYCKDGYIYNDDGAFVIHPGEAVLGSTLERITVPDNLAMYLDGKSSLGRIFLVVHVTAGYFDPGFDGVGTLELVNLNRRPIILRPGLRICQSRWMELKDAAAHPYNGLYQGDTAAAGSRFTD